jgi:hypothetical protein
VDTFEDSRSGASDRFEAFHEQSGIPSIQLNVVLADVSGFKTDGPADDKRHGFRFGLSLPFRNVSSIVLPMKEFMGALVRQGGKGFRRRHRREQGDLASFGNATRGSNILRVGELLPWNLAAELAANSSRAA